jgi:hypothetical protein
VRGGVLPAALLCMALGLTLAFSSRRAWLLSIVLFVTSAIVLVLTTVPPGWVEGVFLGCWISIAATAAAVHVPKGLSTPAAVALSINAGIWVGVVTALSGPRFNLVKTLPCVLALLPAAFIIGKRAPIVVKVLASWLVAVAILAGTLQLLPVTPGYLPDHLE